MRSGRVKILLIDDDEDILTGIKDGLELPGIDFEVMTAGSGMAGLQKAKTNHPHIVILDLQMPKMDGFQVFEELKADPQLKTTKVIMLTAQDSGVNLWKSIDYKIDDFIGKPFDLSELEARIFNLLPE